MEDLETGAYIEFTIIPWLKARGWEVSSINTIGLEKKYAFFKNPTELLNPLIYHSLGSALLSQMSHENIIATQTYVNDLSRLEIDVLKSVGDMYDAYGADREALNKITCPYIKEIWSAMDKLVEVRLEKKEKEANF